MFGNESTLKKGNCSLEKLMKLKEKIILNNGEFNKRKRHFMDIVKQR